MSDSPVRFSHTGICVTDLARSLRFYCEGLGFETAEGYDLDDTMLPGLADALEVPSPVALRSQMITLGPLRIELLAYTEPAPRGEASTSRGSLGLTHLSFVVDDVDAALARAVAAGGTLVEGTDVEVGIRLLFLADPDGTRIELMAG
ncbi:MAG: VOC family protein [Acidimicrobiales bacterium]